MTNLYAAVLCEKIKNAKILVDAHYSFLKISPAFENLFQTYNKQYPEVCQSWDTSQLVDEVEENIVICQRVR